MYRRVNFLHTKFHKLNSINVLHDKITQCVHFLAGLQGCYFLQLSGDLLKPAMNLTMTQLYFPLLCKMFSKRKLYRHKSFPAKHIAVKVRTKRFLIHFHFSFLNMGTSGFQVGLQVPHVVSPIGTFWRKQGTWKRRLEGSWAKLLGQLQTLDAGLSSHWLATEWGHIQHFYGKPGSFFFLSVHPWWTQWHKLLSSSKDN